MVGCTRATFPTIVVPDAAPGGPPDGGTADAGGCRVPDALCTSLPTPPASCNPVCQTGVCPSWCNQKCSIAGDDGSPVCASFGPNKDWDPCNIHNPQSHDQYDDCVAGDICVQDSVSSGAHCFPFCRSSIDCQGEACTQRRIGQAPTTPSPLVCDPMYHLCSGSVPPYSCCDPIGGTVGCLLDQQCYLLAQKDSAGNDYTVCEYATSDGLDNTICENSRDCSPGWFCFPSGPNTGYCRKACSLADPKNNAPCPQNTSCSMGTSLGTVVPDRDV
jgi:hypothetical protein